MRKWQSVFMVIIAVFTMLLLPTHAFAFQTIDKSFGLSEDVWYKQYKYSTGAPQSINHIAVDVAPGKTEVQLGLPTRVNGKETTTSLAMKNSREGNRVVGAINAGFFNMAEGYPLFLLAKDNVIVNGGTVSQGSDEYLNVPTAFGMTADGKGLIDYFDFGITLKRGGKTEAMSGLNRQRNIYEAVIYTPQFYKTHTDTNQYGFEFVVDTGQEITRNTFGQTLKGKVTHIKPYNSTERLTIPRTAFVVSMQGGDWHKKYGDVKIGEEIAVNFSIDNKWKNADYIIASGPMLVKDSKPYIMMSTNSWRAKEKAPRTIVATSDGGKKVHLITVDGRQSHSEGMNMVQLANYLVSLGVERAINLDGGGSTTMGIRNYGSNQIVLANRTSNGGGAQRAVSTILQAVSLEPVSVAKHMLFRIENDIPILEGNGSRITVSLVQDKNRNSLPIDGHITLSSQHGTLTTNGMSYQTTKAGDDRIYVMHDGTVVNSFPVKTVAGPTTMTIAEGDRTLKEGEQLRFTLKDIKDDTGQNILYDERQVKWSVEGDIGSIAGNGTFTAKNAGAKGKVVATLGNQSVAVNVTIAKKGLFTDVPPNHRYEKELAYLVQHNYINGYPDGRFLPDNPISRQHAALILTKVLQLDTTNVQDPGYKDVPKGHVYYNEIAALTTAGIISGADGYFNPQNNVTRAHMSKMIVEAFNLTGSNDKVFTDVSQDFWAYDYIQTLVHNGVATGYLDQSFKPGQAISRIHFSVFLYNSLQVK